MTDAEITQLARDLVKSFNWETSTIDDICNFEIESIWSCLPDDEANSFYDKLLKRVKVLGDKAALKRFDTWFAAVGKNKAIEKVKTENGRVCPPYIIEKVKIINNQPVLTYHVSPPLLAQFIRDNSHYIFVKDNAKDGVNIFWYDNGVYKFVNCEALQGYIKQFISSFDIALLKMSDVREVFNDLTTDIRFIDGDKINANENIINFQNGLLHLDTMTLQAHTPLELSTIQLPCEWNAEQPVSAPVFDSFMKTLTGGDKEKESVLLQFMGVGISNIKGYRMKKALFMVGPGDTGKSQLKSLTERLLGKGNFSGIDLDELEARFGTSNLYNKRLAGSSDMTFITIKELKQFKKATGGDSLFSEFKGENGFEFTYNGLLWFCMNQLPRFGGDNGQWVYNRIILMECKNVIDKAAQDKYLLDKMYLERESIVKMAVNELKKVIENGYEFIIPADCTKRNEKYREENSTVHSFYNECCEARKDGKITDNCTTKKMYDVYVAYCRDNNNGYSVTNVEFKRELERITGLSGDELVVRTAKNNFYSFTLKSEAKRNYGQVYGWEQGL